ncbi:MAG: hypothetical protein BWY37_01858 [Firmicutes bacterium ADurb.Bin262]|nr:MAG: hypothetical protein BWY37_01858 [Firmicutes bacterium ADurb.Bin262]
MAVCRAAAAASIISWWLCVLLMPSGTARASFSFATMAAQLAGVQSDWVSPWACAIRASSWV